MKRMFLLVAAVAAGPMFLMQATAQHSDGVHDASRALADPSRNYHRLAEGNKLSRRPGCCREGIAVAVTMAPSSLPQANSETEVVSATETAERLRKGRA